MQAWDGPDRKLKRYRLIDFSRTIAALAVLIFHYNRFIIETGWGGGPSRQAYIPPLKDILEPIYAHGEYAVPFFWMISGFIFSFVYGSRPATLRSFFARRFARLYPLHFITLIIVALLQTALHIQTGQTLFIPNNDMFHFLLNLLFISAWGFENGLSFNGPIWSVSIELIIYFCFWAFIALVPFRLVGAILLTVLFAVLTKTPAFSLVALCGVMFFFGAAISFVSSRCTTRAFSVIALLAPVLAGSAMIYLPYVAASNTLSLMLIFGSILAVIAALDQIAGDRFRPIDWMAAVGDLSYSIYLLHFPLILGLVCFALLTGLGQETFSGNALILTGFIGSALGLSAASLTLVENPARRYFQRLLEGRRAAFR